MSPPFEVVAVEEILAVDFEGNFSFGGVIAACLDRIMATIFWNQQFLFEKMLQWVLVV